MNKIVRVTEDHVDFIRVLHDINFQMNYCEEFYTHIVDDPKLGAYVCILDEHVVGEISYKKKSHESEKHIYITTLSVDSNYRRRGIATSLLLHLFNEHIDTNVFSLHTEESNIPAQTLYSSMGFELEGIVSLYYTTEDAYYMVRRKEFY